MLIARAIVILLLALAPTHAWAQAACPTPNPNASAWTTLTGPPFKGVDSVPSVNCSLPAGGLNGAFSTLATALSAGTCPTGWNCVQPSGNGNLTTGTDADHTLLQNAATTSATKPVLLAPGIYYNCSTINIPRYGVFGNPYIMSWKGGGAPGETIPFPAADPLVILCANATSTTSMIHLHDDTKVMGFAMQGNRQASGSTNNMTCVDGINSVSATITNMQFYDCHNGVDLSSSSTAGDQGTTTLDTVLKHLAFDYTGRGIFSTTANGGNGTSDQHWDDLEFEVSLNGGFYMNNGMDGQITNIRGEDTGGQYVGYINGGQVQMSHVWCNNMPCLNIVGGTKLNLSDVNCYSQFSTTWCLIAGALGNQSTISHMRCDYPAGSGRCVLIGSVTAGQVTDINCTMTTSDPCVWFPQTGNTSANVSGINVCFSGNCNVIEVDTNGFTSSFVITNTSFAAVELTGTLSGTLLVDTTSTYFNQATATAAVLQSPTPAIMTANYAQIPWTLAAGAGQIPACTSAQSGKQLVVTDGASDISAGAGGGSAHTLVTCMNTTGTTYAWKGFAGT